MEITIHRDPPLASAARQLPAATYNLMHGLLARSRGPLFVPLRAMQFLAIVDAEEVVFIDHLRKDAAVVAWQGFRPQDRGGLDDPVAYRALYYRDDGAALMGRLQGEFARALAAQAGKERPDGPARVLGFGRRG